MSLPPAGRRRIALAAIVFSMAAPSHAAAQDEPTFRLGPGPWVVETFAPSSRVRVSVVARGIANPWGMAFLPD
jgi:glucose/arabinose dehydrogenase